MIRQRAEINGKTAALEKTGKDLEVVSNQIVFHRGLGTELDTTDTIRYLIPEGNCK